MSHIKGTAGSGRRRGDSDEGFHHSESKRQDSFYGSNATGDHSGNKRRHRDDPEEAATAASRNGYEDDQTDARDRNSHKRSRHSGSSNTDNDSRWGAPQSSRGAQAAPHERTNEHGRRQRQGEHLESSRQARMAQLRAENEKEEARLAAAGDGGAQGLGRGGGGPSSDHKASTRLQKGSDDDENDEEDDEDNETRLMQQMLGFGDFGTTKNSAVATNRTTAARGTAAKHKARKYRQYMNRKNGFNRPLDKMA